MAKTLIFAAFLLIKLSDGFSWDEISKSVEDENDEDHVNSFLEEQKKQGFSEKEVFEKVKNDKTIARKLVATKFIKNESGGQKRVILIGTRYCGHGNNSKSDDERGFLNELDECCYEHDKCKLSIEAGKFRWGLHNTKDYTISDCKCDDKFYSCLKDVESFGQRFIATTVGKLFFNIKNIKCIEIPKGFDPDSDKESYKNTYEPTPDGSPQPYFRAPKHFK
ncbi:phospholipase A2 phaiodactylipin-like [Hydra vulgaris]|uniref:Phospholipase A2 phaiodactylipin-like n=1 Tax=Hydra vulgaris TaxID=6087 RepID=A0ABM4C9Q3_HYDVU